MTVMGLEQTYKAVILRNFFDEELTELEKRKEQFIGKGTVEKDKLLRFTMKFVLYLSLIMLVLNFLPRPYWTTFFYYPLHLLASVMIAFPIVLAFYLYNVFMRKVNVVKKRKSMELLRYQQSKEAVETNRNTISNMLKSNSKIPTKYQDKKTLEILIQYMNSGRATSEGYAMYLFEREHPNYFVKTSGY